MQRTGRSKNRPSTASTGRNSAALNLTELQQGHLRRSNGSHGAQLGLSQFVSLMLFAPFTYVVERAKAVSGIV
jgi:hypothetical protein